MDIISNLGFKIVLGVTLFSLFFWTILIVKNFIQTRNKRLMARISIFLFLQIILVLVYYWEPSTSVLDKPSIAPSFFYSMLIFWGLIILLAVGAVLLLASNLSGYIYKGEQLNPNAGLYIAIWITISILVLYFIKTVPIF